MRKFRSALFLLLLFAARAGAQTDSLFYHLDSVAISSVRNTSPIRGSLDKTLSIGMDKAAALPALLGSADPLRYAQSLPGVQTNSEMDAGLRVLGCDNSHNFISIGDAPVYGASHMLGFFSNFNPTHYDIMSFSTSSDQLRLGGELTMERADSVRSAGFDGTLGTMILQGSVTLPVSKKSSLTLSARMFPLFGMYNNCIRIGKADINYGFFDFNSTYEANLGGNDFLSVDIYEGVDKCKADAKLYGFNADIRWSNTMASASWTHREGDFKSRLSAYYSGYHNDLELTQHDLMFLLPSSLDNIGLTGHLNFGEWDFSASAGYYNILPQAPCLNDAPVGTTTQERQHAAEFMLGGKRAFEIGPLTLTPAINASHFRNGENYFAIDPSLDVELNLLRMGRMSLSLGSAHQYLFQTGIVSSGFPLEFWFASGEYSDPQRALSASLSHNVDIGNGAWTLSSQIYHKRLFNQVEYTGGLYDVLATGYSLEKAIKKGDGWSYGFLLMLQKRSGALTGWVSYSFGRALRRFEGSDTLVPSNHERVHELNAVATYKSGKWEFGANFVGASGLPYTPIEGFCIVSGAIVTKYGEPNSMRLPPYVRLDLSATYSLPSRAFDHKLCMSIYNATCHQNTLMYHLAIKDDTYMLEEVNFAIPILPSLSYVIDF